MGQVVQVDSKYSKGRHYKKESSEQPVKLIDKSSFNSNKDLENENSANLQDIKNLTSPNEKSPKPSFLAKGHYSPKIKKKYDESKIGQISEILKPKNIQIVSTKKIKSSITSTSNSLFEYHEFERQNANNNPQCDHWLDKIKNGISEIEKDQYPKENIPVEVLNELSSDAIIFKVEASKNELTANYWISQNKEFAIKILSGKWKLFSDQAEELYYDGTSIEDLKEKERRRKEDERLKSYKLSARQFYGNPHHDKQKSINFMDNNFKLDSAYTSLNNSRRNLTSGSFISNGSYRIVFKRAIHKSSFMSENFINKETQNKISKLHISDLFVSENDSQNDNGNATRSKNKITVSKRKGSLPQIAEYKLGALCAYIPGSNSIAIKDSLVYLSPVSGPIVLYQYNPLPNSKPSGHIIVAIEGGSREKYSDIERMLSWDLNLIDNSVSNLSSSERLVLLNINKMRLNPRRFAELYIPAKMNEPGLSATKTSYLKEINDLLLYETSKLEFKNHSGLNKVSMRLNNNIEDLLDMYTDTEIDEFIRKQFKVERVTMPSKVKYDIVFTSSEPLSISLKLIGNFLEGLKLEKDNLLNRIRNGEQVKKKVTWKIPTLFYKEFNYIGISLRTHSVYEYITIVTYASFYPFFNSILNTNV